MKKTRIMRLIVALLLTISIIGANGTKAMAAGGCSNWELVGLSNDYCDEDDGCGFLWLKDTHKQGKLYKRTCVDYTGNISYEFKIEMEKLGCC